MDHQIVSAQLTPENSALILVDYQLQFASTVSSLDQHTLVNNAIGLGKAAKLFRIPVILTSLGRGGFGGPLLSQIHGLLPHQAPMERAVLSFWEDKRVAAAIRRLGRKNLIVAGLWTDFSVSASVIQVVRAGFKVYVVSDACGDVSGRAHRIALNRMRQASAVSILWLKVLSELQHRSPSAQTNPAVLHLVREYGGATTSGMPL